MNLKNRSLDTLANSLTDSYKLVLITAIGYRKKFKITIMVTTIDFKITKMSPQFLVADIERSIEFYTRNLGFDIEFRYEDFYAGIVKDGYSIHLKLGKPAKNARKGYRNNEDLDIVFAVDSIEDLYEALSIRPIEFVQPLRDMPYGKEFYIMDPDGYIIAFMSAATPATISS